MKSSDMTGSKWRVAKFRLIRIEWFRSCWTKTKGMLLAKPISTIGYPKTIAGFDSTDITQNGRTYSHAPTTCSKVFNCTRIYRCISGTFNTVALRMFKVIFAGKPDFRRRDVVLCCLSIEFSQEDKHVGSWLKIALVAYRENAEKNKDRARRIEKY